MRTTLFVCLSPTIQHTILFDSLEKGAVNRSRKYRLDASGKAVNAARVFSQLAQPATVIVPLGAENASLFLGLAESDGLSVESISVPGSIRHCYTLLETVSINAGDINAGENTSISTSVTELVVGEPAEPSDSHSASPANYASLSSDFLSLAERNLAEADALVLSGSKPSFWSETLFVDIISLAKRASCPVLADFQGPDLLRAVSSCVPDIIKINESEFCHTFVFPFPMEESALGAAICDRSRVLNCCIVVTRGMKDTFAGFFGEFFIEPVKPVAAVNSIGCGDSFAAGFMCKWLASRSPVLSLASGTDCATRNALSYRPGSILDPSSASERFPKFPE